jgi:hypothetical protein
MPFKRPYFLGLGVLLLTSMACAKNPLSPGSISTPQVLIPTTGTLIPNSAQPVTLVAQNALGTATSATTYTFEIATDSAFANKVQTKTVAEGAGGQTSATLSALPANADYFWHVQATAGSTTGLFSAASKFTIGPAVSLGTPGLVSPANGSTVSTQPTLTVTNASHTGSVGAVAYRFDVSTSSTFATITYTGTAAEGAGQTSLTVTTALAVSTTFYWRATAIDTTNIATSPASATGNFTTAAFSGAAGNLAAQLGLVLWPGAVPGGVNGHAVMGTNCNRDANWGPHSADAPPNTCYSPLNGGFYFPSPTLIMLQYFDLFDRGYDPPSAIAWLNANGYPTNAQWYPPPDKAVLGLGTVYLAARDLYIGPGAIWDIVVGLG